MTMKAEIVPGQLAELVKQVQAGNDILLTQDNQPVARIVAASDKKHSSGALPEIRSIKGHRVLIPTVSGSELADDMFSRE